MWRKLRIAKIKKKKIDNERKQKEVPLTLQGYFALDYMQ
jgi:hypothetical protein